MYCKDLLKYDFLLILYHLAVEFWRRKLMQTLNYAAYGTDANGRTQMRGFVEFYLSFSEYSQKMTHQYEAFCTIYLLVTSRHCKYVI